MLSPSRGFCYCLPVRLGALVVSLFTFSGSGILAGVTFHSLAIISSHITSIQTAGFYLASLSWATLSAFSLLGLISVILQHPLLLTIFARFVIYHLPAGMLCNLFFTIVLFASYRDADAIIHSSQCHQIPPRTSICDAFASLQTLTWVYLFILLSTCVVQTYVYVIIRRFIFVISGEWDLEQEEVLEKQRRSVGKTPHRQRRTTVTQTIGHGGRRRAKAQLWFTMETPEADADDSFLPSMILSPMDFTTPPRTPFSMASTAPLLSPFRSPKIGKKASKSSLPMLSSSTPEVKKGKDGLSDRSAQMDMDFSDPDPSKQSPQPSEWLKPQTSPQEKSLPPNPKDTRQSDGSKYSVASAHDVLPGGSVGT